MPVKPKTKSEIKWIVAIILCIGVVVLLFKIPLLTIPLLVLLPIFSFLVLTNYLTITNSTKRLHYLILLATFIIAIVFLLNRKQVVYKCSEPFVDGRYRKEEILVGSEDDYGYETVNEYVPKTKKGENAMKFIEITLIAISIGSVALSYRTAQLYNAGN